MNNKNKLDVHSTQSDRPGILGKIEVFVRKFRSLGFALTLAPIALIYVISIGISLTPGIILFQYVLEISQPYSVLLKAFLLGCTIASSFFMYGMILIFIVPFFNLFIVRSVKTQRATWFSLSVIPWYYHNALTYLVRYTFIDLITPTPFNRLFYQMMGMKIGKGTIINTSNISDPCLIELGENVTIGGSASLIAHYGMKGFLIIDRLVIKDEAVIGMKSTIFGDVIIEKGAQVKPGEVILPKSRISS